MRDAFLSQNAFEPNDAYCPLAKQAALLGLIMTLYRGGRDLIKAGAELAAISALPCLPEIMRAKTAYAGGDMDGLARLGARVKEELEGLGKKPSREEAA